jgi:hypothetical protein
LRNAIEAYGGYLFKHSGDGVCAAFASPKAGGVRKFVLTGDAIAQDAQRAFSRTPLNCASQVLGVASAVAVIGVEPLEDDPDQAAFE